MSISEFLFGKWIVLDRISATYTKRIFFSYYDKDGEVIVEENIRTGVKRARLIGDGDIVELDLQEALAEIQKYRLSKVKTDAHKTNRDGWKVELPPDSYFEEVAVK